MPGLLPTFSPQVDEESSPSVALLLEARPRDLGGFSVRRALPSPRMRRVGPFVFFDQMGPATLPVDRGLDVRPHPHIALATVTYLFEGEILHRDSLGNTQPIRPGDVNWMIAGRGIVHSERSHPPQGQALSIHGIQSWVALPLEREEMDPAFEHHPEASLPVVRRPGTVFDVIAGSAFGATSPVGVLSPTLYVHGRLEADASFVLDNEHEERALYLVEGTMICDGRTYEAGSLLVFRAGREVVLQATGAARIMLLGGAPLEGERHIFWNFVASSLERIERAKLDWAEGRFPKVPGDEREFIPLPDEAH